MSLNYFRNNVKLEIEVFFYDEANDITDIEADIIHMKANSEFAYEFQMKFKLKRLLILK